MNSAYRKRQAREDRASAALGVLGALLLAGVACLLAWAIWHAMASIPAGWWLPVGARPFGGRWPL